MARNGNRNGRPQGAGTRLTLVGLNSKGMSKASMKLFEKGPMDGSFTSILTAHAGIRSSEKPTLPRIPASWEKCQVKSSALIESTARIATVLPQTIC